MGRIPQRKNMNKIFKNPSGEDIKIFRPKKCKTCKWWQFCTAQHDADQVIVTCSELTCRNCKGRPACLTEWRRLVEIYGISMSRDLWNKKKDVPIPTVEGYHTAGGDIEIFCPYCQTWHHHGLLRGRDHGSGYRGAHCSCNSPFALTGYVIKDMDSAEIPNKKINVFIKVL